MLPTEKARLARSLLAHSQKPFDPAFSPTSTNPEGHSRQLARRSSYVAPWSPPGTTGRISPHSAVHHFRALRTSRHGLPDPEQSSGGRCESKPDGDRMRPHANGADTDPAATGEVEPLGPPRPEAERGRSRDLRAVVAIREQRVAIGGGLEQTGGDRRPTREIDLARGDRITAPSASGPLWKTLRDLAATSAAAECARLVVDPSHLRVVAGRQAGTADRLRRARELVAHVRPVGEEHDPASSIGQRLQRLPPLFALTRAP